MINRRNLLKLGASVPFLIAAPRELPVRSIPKRLPVGSIIVGMIPPSGTLEGKWVRADGVNNRYLGSGINYCHHKLKVQLYERVE